MNRAYYSDMIADFLERDDESILGMLTKKSAFDITMEQRDAWQKTICVMKKAVADYRGRGKIYFEFGPHLYHVYGISSNLSATATSVGITATPAEISPGMQGLLLALNQRNECRRLADGEFYLDVNGDATLDDYAAQDENNLTRASYPN